MGRYYSFEVNGQYMASNEQEELIFVTKDENGKLPENAKWYIKPIGEVYKDTPAYDGYVVFNKDAAYNGSNVCIEYYSSVFSGWTFKAADHSIFIFQFYKVGDDVKVYDDTVQDPSVVFNCANMRHLEEDFHVSVALDDLAEDITDIKISYQVGDRVVNVEDYEVTSDKKGYTFDLAAADIDGDEKPTSFKILVDVTNSYGISYSGSKTIEIIDAPFFANLTPAPNSQTGEDVRPVISAKVGNVGDAPEFLMRVNDEEVEAVWENGVLSYTSAEDMPLGRTTVYMRCTRADGVSEEQYWTFTVGTSDFQLYFGQLHSHTTYSDGAGTLDSALEYIASLPESANIDFVAFTDHSNYFDAETAANPADAMNDPDLMTPASRAEWEEYKGKAADFNASHTDLIAIAGYEMTWSGGPGHINSYNTKGLVSRNNAALNNKTSDAGMKLYYETISKDDGTSLHQFNHPGTTFGNFSNFAYWNEATDARMFLVEVGNGEGQIGAGGYYPSYEQYTLALDRGWHLAPTNNQDNHKGRWGNANDARDVVLAENFSEEGIYDAIRALRVYATEDKNFELTYLANGEQMGTVFTEENMPEKFIPEITMYDPDSSDSVKKVELIVDNGAVAYTWNDAEELAKGYVTAELPIEYTYYFVRVTQADGDLIVTAPVWFGSALDLGIEKIAPAEEPLYTNTDITLNTVFFNHEDEQATITSIVYTDGGSKVYATDTTQKTIPANGTLTVDANIGSFDVAKHTNVTVTAVIKCGEKEITVTSDVYLDILDKEAGVSTIKEVRDASVLGEEGLVFVIEGVVTSNASGYDKDTAFFDAIYVQDETAGICAFPVSGNFKIGDKVHIVGYTDFYQGEPELQVSSIEVIGEGTVEPTEINATDLNNRSAEGKLVTIKGTVESFEYAEELVQTILVKDNENQIARVFIDGYITTTDEVKNLAVGASIEATGMASYDDTWPDVDHFPRIRIRNRADVIIAPTEKSFDIEDLPLDVTYNGNEQKAKVVAHDTETGDVLTEGTDYEVAYTGNLVNVGTVTVTVTGKGLYTGEIVRTYDISPLAVNVTITGNSGERIYTGKEQKIEGYTFKADSDLYKEEYVTLDGEAVAKGTNASDERYYMCLTKEKFHNTNNNFTVTFKVTDGYLEIINAELKVKIDDATKVYGDADPEYTVTITNMEGDDTAEKMLEVLKEAGMAFTREEGEDAGTYTVRFTDPNLRIPNYNVNPTNGKLTITKKAATLTAEDLTKVYGEADPALKVTTEGVKTGDTLNYTVAREEGEDVGEYRITITLGENPNYEIKTEEGSLKITRKAVTIKVNDASKTAGEADPAFSGTITGLVKEGDLGTVRFVRENTAEEAGVYKDVLNAVYTENGNYDVTVVKGSFEIKEAPLPPVTYTLTRLSGKDRYLTSMKAADELKAVLGVDKFDSVILATGKNFADALGGGYLAAKKSAPILLTSDNKAADINAYINENLKEGGTVYVLGGTAAVSDEALEGVNGKVVRLSGKDRYLTNLAILNEAGVTNEDILVCSGNNFADALAASASGRPMLLVNTKKNTLTDGQKEFLASHTANKLYIIGGTGAVSAAIEEEVKTYGTPERVKGATRYETSVEIAKKFFSSPEKALIAYSDDYPDGLCAGPLGYALKSPILLTKPGKEASLKDYCSSYSITNGYIIGGEARIPDDSARDIFSAPSDTVVVKK
ncbi:MAG: cell wall-binding repeat-containing protein [Erysipelotrichaceae bacterium]|nr:cell wall-binding repeat-containing protein [Erysipelotrichaceae bacterium]